MLTRKSRQLIIKDYIPVKPNNGWLTPEGVTELLRLSLMEKEEKDTLTKTDNNIKDNFVDAKKFIFQKMTTEE